MGFAKPWIMVRTQRYLVDHSYANITGDLGQYFGKQQAATSSFGDELGDAVDLWLTCGWQNASSLWMHTFETRWRSLLTMFTKIFQSPKTPSRSLKRR